MVGHLSAKYTLALPNSLNFLNRPVLFPLKNGGLINMFSDTRTSVLLTYTLNATRIHQSLVTSSVGMITLAKF